MTRMLLAGAALMLPTPALAQDPLAPLPPAATPQAQVPTAAPPVLQPAPPPQPVVQIPRDWRGVFAAIRSGQWASAQAGIAVLPPHVLAPVAKAELYTAKGSPTVSLQQLLALLAEAPELPHAEQLARMALSRGATEALIVPRNRMLNLGAAPSRNRARAVSGEPAADALRVQIDPLIKDNMAPEAEALLIQAAPFLSFDARAEAAQRIAWTYYVLGRDTDARRLADSGRIGATGEWVSHSAWVSGLSSWRMSDWEAASRAFREVAGSAREPELRAAGYYWAARAEQAARRPRSVAPLLRAAAASRESFYGLIARETLGMDTRLPADLHSMAANVEGLPNVRRAVELVNIGERAMGEEMLRHQARIGRPADHHGLIELSKKLDLAGAQFWLGHFGPAGATADAADRYPVPRWTPARGWRIEPALALAHIRQESNFRTDAVSPAGAVGAMQVVPSTAAEIAAKQGLAYSRASLHDPAYNLEYGQSFIENMRRSGATAGQLPRVIAAYNAGATPVSRWRGLYDKGDPLLWIESLTYWETRYYVPAVFRNLWVYQGLMNRPTPTLKSMAQHHWPAFPTPSASLASK